jgi:hypothetical protein
METDDVYGKVETLDVYGKVSVCNVADLHITFYLYLFMYFLI